MIVWRGVGAPGENYPGWLRQLSGKSGVYAIRQAGLLGGKQIVYVGESHKGRLRKTITRHLQSWGRVKDWWRQFYGQEDTDPGRVYPRERCEIAIEVSPPGRAVKLQQEWIDRLKPRDNLLVGGGEAAPF